MVRVGIVDSVPAELLEDFPKEAEIIRIPAGLSEPLAIDFWMPSFSRKEAEATFAMLRGVKVVQSMLAGVDWILPWLPKGIVLCDGQGLHDTPVSEWVLGAILASLRRLPLYRDKQRAEQWRGPGDARDALVDTGGLYQVLGDDLSGKTVLIVGYGSIGQAIEKRLKPFEVNVLRIARTAKSEPEVHPVGDLHRLLPEADIVVAIVPMTPATKGLFAAPELALMRPNALFINAARGPVVVTEDLVQALWEGRISAVLDVTDPEPLPVGHPLWSAPNCLITPHVASSTPALMRKTYGFGAKQVKRMIEGRALENVVSEAGY